MSIEETVVIMYAQALTFLLVILFIISYFFMHRKSEVKVEVTNLEEYEKEREKNYIEVIYEESHREESKIQNVRLHKKHNNF